jgi:S-methylmethionine-dependent homocysteine/selenocysteine methylase
MSNSPAVQAARKKMQLARLEAKKKEGYPAFYAAQPYQVERAKLNKEYQVARNNLSAANEALEIALITGEGLNAAKEAQAIAALVAERSKPPRRGATSSAGLTGA